MAAEVPAKDVLCEAMEYLSKLGSNLRTRSENLRDKRIRREKLNNVIAVQKAAAKVLMICELSKKSLENVESGVRKVLQTVERSQASLSDGGKKTEPRIDSKPVYYIKYKSRQLRIKNKISFKHYNSVRVYAKSLPQAMMDKYPVYYDCKLYRLRKKLAQQQKDKEIARKKSVTSTNSKSDDETLESKGNDDKTVAKRLSTDSTKASLTNDEIDSENNSSKHKASGTDFKHGNNLENRQYHTSDDESAESNIAKTKSMQISNDDSINKEEETGRQPSLKRKIIISDSDSNNEEGAAKNNDAESSDNPNPKKTKLNEDSNEVSCNENSNDSVNESKKPMIKCVSITKLLKPSVLSKEHAKKDLKPKLKNEVSYSEKQKKLEAFNKQKERDKQDKKLEEQARKKNAEEEYWVLKRKEVSNFKSKEFVINVDRLPELTSNYLKKLNLQRIIMAATTVCEINSEKQNDESRSRHNSFDDNALIAEANKVKNSLLNESESEDELGSSNESKSSKNETEVVKKALLNDSDSDCNKSDEEIQSNCNKKKVKGKDETNTQKDKDAPDTQKNNDEIDDTTKNLNSKKVLCDDAASGSDNENETSTRPVPENSKQQSSKDIDSGSSSPVPVSNIMSNKLKEISGNEAETEKRLADEVHSNKDDDSKDNGKDRSQQCSKETSDIDVNSSDAKKMLLAHSASEAEDEELKGALKEIKDSLLHGSDDENKEQKKSNKCSDSSSEEDITKHRKKKKHKTDKEKRHKHNIRKKQRRRIDSDNSSDGDSKSSKSKMVRSKSKPGNSSCQTSDAPDSSDKDIDGLTNLKSLNKPRRRDSSEMEEETVTTRNSKNKEAKVKPTGLISEEMLKAESSSESSAGSADDKVEDEDMPVVSVPSFNGISDHLDKENLLGDSDSSASHNDNDNDETEIKAESDADEKSNSKRRKAIAISSDSEVGSSQKKDADFGDKMSDFEDSEDSDVGTKRTKRKKKPVDSDASVGSGSSNEAGKKKRRRIKSLNDSEGSGSESETEGRNKHGRKNIRKVMGKNQLEEATKKAAREEKERIARIAERQKMYNNLQFDESGKPDEVVLDKVVLDFDPETKEPLIEVDRGLVKKLKPHQANGIKFMWDACFESVKRIKKDRGSGCILAHCMGLGKTLQVVTLTHTLLTHGDLTNTNRVLVVCPLSTVLNWVNEFRMWLKYAETEFDVEVYELSRFKQNSERAFQLSQWFRHGGVCVLGYEMFRNLSADNAKKFKKKMLKNFQEALVDPGPDLVVCDEGHLLKNEKTSLSQSMNRVRTRRRIVLTGTPLQNNLKEYYCMVQFVKPNLLGKYNEYLNRFVNPITNGQYTDSTEHDIKIMKRRSHVLHKMLDGAVQRRDYGVLAPFLPPKHEYVLFITLSEVQTKLYQHYLDNFSRRPLPGKSSGFLFPDFQSLQRIWTHPLVLKYNSERYEIMQQKKRDKEEEEDSEGSLRDFIDDDSTSEESMTDDSTDDSSDMSDDSRKKSKKKKKSSKKSKGKDKEIKGEGQSRSRRGTRANPVEIDDEDKDDDVIELKNENPTEWWIKLVTDDELEDMRNSHKLVLLFDILRQCEAIGDKLLVFSQSLYSLDLIEHFLGKVDDATQEGRIDEKLGGHIGTWSPGVDYFRLDGSTSCENRSIWCKNFNREDNPRARLFLISTRAGGLGINLVAANRVVIFDVSWNPSHDVQSIFRVYRFGQKKPCYVYRFLAMGTMEEKIYERQVTKQAISKRVIDEQQIDRHYAENDLAELYKFEPQPPTPRPIPPLPKDRLFAEMLREHEAQIYKYHEHDSLLENKEEETLSEEERKAAWEDFENEKNKPPPQPFPSTWQMNMLQQQQLAYAALAAMLRKDMPNVSDNQLRDMIPLIYNSNPQMFGGYDFGLMQKMSEIYKYAPTMMNPGMMNPAMNMNAGPGGVAGGGMSGASGLQYEPPWQRQQQQQQQMRLQQLLQQQNPMGAKFYAGGLGSRDPVAMALQHQRAREIMMGGAGAGAGAGRPRGRPPLQPRAPPPGDVVNLDSD